MRVEFSKVAIMLREDDDVAVATTDISKDSFLHTGDLRIGIRQDIPAGHKFALHTIERNAPIRKYGQTIGFATETILPGSHVHTHNVSVRDFLRDSTYCSDAPDTVYLPSAEAPTFAGYPREDGRVGTRNYLAIISTVNCSASVSRYIADQIKQEGLDEYPNVDGVIALKTQGGCASGIGDEDYHTLQRVLSGFALHPNVGAYLLVGLGCETNQAVALIENQGLRREGCLPPQVINIQDCGGIEKTVRAGVTAARELLPYVNSCSRTPQPVSKLVLATQCGGSDGNSGITANPALGAAADLLVRHGGTVVLGETPEIYGAEHLLLRRARSRQVAEKLVARIHWWEEYVARCNSAINNNPTPGNKAGGITTIYEKSLGAVAKGGTEVLNDVYLYAEKIRTRGLVFMDTPGYDPVSVTGLVAGGCNIIVFTTGRGSVSGVKPVPCIKVATNTRLYQHMAGDMDLNAGEILEGVTVEEVGRGIFEEIIAVASGKKTKSEIQEVGDEEFVPWTIGPVL